MSVLHVCRLTPGNGTTQLGVSHRQQPVPEDLPVVILQLNVVAGLQDLPVPQPSDLRGGFPLGHAREDGSSPHGPGNGLGMLHELCGGCKEEGEAG